MGQCRTCKKEVANDAKMCPHCGADKPTEAGCLRATRNIGSCLIGLGILLFVIYLVFLFLT